MTRELAAVMGIGFIGCYAIAVFALERRKYNRWKQSGSGGFAARLGLLGSWSYLILGAIGIALIYGLILDPGSELGQWIAGLLGVPMG